MSYRPSLPFNVPARIIRAEYKKVNGVNKKVWTDGANIFVSAKSYGGTERIINDKVVIEDTIVIETWYRPDITGKDGLRLMDDGSEWEIMDNPDNIDRRNQFLRFKVKRMVGGA